MARINRKLPQLTTQETNRFWSKVDKTPGQGRDGDCWQWTAGRSAGYGSFSLQKVGSNIGANRIAYFLSTGFDPEQLLVCHTCDNPPCCNPNHLFLGTAKDNLLDAKKKGRIPTGDLAWSHLHADRLARGERNGAYTKPERRPKGEKHGNSRFSDSDILEIRHLSKKGLTDAELAIIYNANRATIWAIVREKAWIHLLHPSPAQK